MAAVMNPSGTGCSTCIYIHSVFMCQIQKRGRQLGAFPFPPCTVDLYPLNMRIITRPQLKYFNGRAAGATSTPSSSSYPFPVPETNTLSLSADNSDATLRSWSWSWSEFATNVSGEWDGFGADFTMEGKPIELPEAVVPEAYREWEVQVFDWQTQCPTLAEPADIHSEDDNISESTDRHDRRIFFYKSIKLLPTVGCEADAATRYSVNERNINMMDVKFAYQSTTGCYVAVWPVEMQENKWELEFCLISPQDRESRVRLIQVVRVVEEVEPKSSNHKKSTCRMVLERIAVFREQWYGPFRDGDQLGGCAIRDSGFASAPPTTASQVSGVWHQDLRAAASFLHHSTDESVAELLAVDFDGESRRRETARSGLDVILLPKQLWCSVRQSEDDAGTLCEVGWILDHGRLLTSSCIFSSTATLKEISVALETREITGVRV